MIDKQKTITQQKKTAQTTQAKATPKKENKRHKEAFMYYFKMKDRNFEDVANKFNVGIQTVYNWSYHFNWKERIAQMDAEVSSKIEGKAIEKTITEIVNYKENFLKTLNRSVEIFAENLEKGTVKITDVNTLDKLADIYNKIIGGANTNCGVNVNVNNSFENLKDDDLDKIINSLKQ